MTRSLSLVPEPVKPTVSFPTGPWYPWFANEFAPLRHSAVDSSAEYRRRVTRNSPLRFALIYLDRWLVLQGVYPPTVTFSEFHLALCRSAARLAEPKRWREAWIAPRGMGKSVWFFLVLPLWAIAHGHRRFFLAFCWNENQAKGHLANLRLELETNELLRNDFPELAPQRIRGSRNTQTTVVANGGTFEAVGLGGTILGRRQGTDRTDFMIGDDIEPDEEEYSVEQRDALLRKILKSLLPMGTAHTAVAIAGTVTMYRSITHDFVLHAKEREHIDWIDDNGFVPRVFPGIIENPDGSLRSLWPHRWPLTKTHLGEHKIGTREFEHNFMLDPRPDQVGKGGGFWLPTTFQYMDVDRFNAMDYALVIDPGLKTEPDKHDFTAMVVVGRSYDQRRAIIVNATHGHWSGEHIRQRIHLLAERSPDLCTLIFEENAAGAEHWAKVLEPDRGHPLPKQFERNGRKVQWEWAKGHKIVRAKRALAAYERGVVFHAKGALLKELEEEMLRFPDPGAHDDLVDATAAGLRWALG